MSEGSGPWATDNQTQLDELQCTAMGGKASRLEGVPLS